MGCQEYLNIPISLGVPGMKTEALYWNSVDFGWIWSVRVGIEIK